MNSPVVSICILTYQHSRFIAKSMEGALMQKTDFPFEVLIGEDESADGTRDICLDFAKRHPDLVRVFLRHRRDVVLIDGRPRGSFNFRMTLREAKGEFVALCEGDDYWTDPEKLQRQVDYLRNNPDCVGCFHDTKLVDADGQTLQESYFASDQDKFTQEDVLGALLSCEPTCSLMFRRSAFVDPLPDWYLRRPSDLYLDILLTNHGSLGFVRHNMGAYRKHTGGIWSGQRESNQIIELIIRLKLLLADSFFIEKYRDLLFRKIDELQASLFTRKDFAGEIDRLEGVVHEQTKAIESMQSERTRLSAVAKKAEAEAKRAANDAQQHIDALIAQLAQLAETLREQTTYIGVLQTEQKRWQQEAEEAKAEAGRARADAQQHIDALSGQLAQLAGTSREQTAYIGVLEAEQKRLQQEGEAAKAETDRAKADAQQQIDSLSGQLAQLAETSREQATYIGVLEGERNRLSEELSEARVESKRQISVIDEQLSYIKILELERGQAKPSV
jgi:glycosyltransferase involved in cell wall biosynthesis